MDRFARYTREVSDRERHIRTLLDGEAARLHPELRCFAATPDNVTLNLQHPLVDVGTVRTGTVDQVNAIFLAARREAHHAFQTGRWAAYLTAFRPGFRLGALALISPRVDDATFHGLFDLAWVSDESGVGDHIPALVARRHRFGDVSGLPARVDLFAGVVMDGAADHMAAVGWRWHLGENAARTAVEVARAGDESKSGWLVSTSVVRDHVAAFVHSVDEVAVDPNNINHVAHEIVLTPGQEDILHADACGYGGTV